MTLAKEIVAEIERLPEPLAREVLDFIEYLEVKHGLRSGSLEELKSAQKPVMERFWSNSQDDVWNDL